MLDSTANYSGRQYELCAVIDFDFSTFVEDEVTQVFALPSGAVITAVVLQVRTAWDNTTPTFNVGRYIASPTDPDDFIDGVALGTGDETFQVSVYDAATEAAMDAGDVNHVDVPNDSIAVLYAAASGAATAGAATLLVKYVVRGRDQENQG
jgi:hypothetical protein